MKLLKRKDIFVCEENILEDSLEKFLFIKIILLEDQAVKEAFVWRS